VSEYAYFSSRQWPHSSTVLSQLGILLLYLACVLKTLKNVPEGRANSRHRVSYPAAAILFVNKRGAITVLHNNSKTYTRSGNKVPGLV
jgi:hypothetical protein